MKKYILTFLFLVVLIAGFSQNLYFDYTRNNSISIKIENLPSANLLSDVIPDYPSLWIHTCVSSEITGICDGKTTSAISTNDTLSNEQKTILKSIDLGTVIQINMVYKYNNTVNNTIETDKMHLSAIIMPETEAEFPSGYEGLTNYLKETATNKIPESKIKQLSRVSVKFIINEEGEINGTKISKSSFDPITDQLLLDAVNKMPKWKPAKNSKGIKIKQEFEFSIGSPKGC